MTKQWSSTASGDGKTKRRASKGGRRKAERSIRKWIDDQGAVESVKYDEDTGQPYRTFTIDLTK